MYIFSLQITKGNNNMSKSFLIVLLAVPSPEYVKHSTKTLKLSNSVVKNLDLASFIEKFSNLFDECDKRNPVKTNKPVIALQTTKKSSVPARPVTNPLAHKKRAVALYRAGKSPKNIIRSMGNLNGTFPPPNTPHEGQSVWAWAREIDILENKQTGYSAGEYKRNK